MSHHYEYNKRLEHNNRREYYYKVFINGQEIKEPRNYSYGFRGEQRLFTLEQLNEILFTFEGKRYLKRHIVYGASKTMENRFYPYSSYNNSYHATKPLDSIRIVKVKNTKGLPKEQRTEEERQRRKERFIKTVENKIKCKEDDLIRRRKYLKRDIKSIRNRFKREQNDDKKYIKKLNKILSEV